MKIVMRVQDALPPASPKGDTLHGCEMVSNMGNYIGMILLEKHSLTSVLPGFTRLHLCFHAV